MVSKFKKYILKGINQPLDKMPFHDKVPFTRKVMLDNKLVPESEYKIAVHFIDKLPKNKNYSKLHKHSFNEVNIVLSFDKAFTFRFQLENEIYIVKSPTTVFIPANVNHSSNVLNGKGFLFCIYFDNSK